MRIVTRLALLAVAATLAVGAIPANAALPGDNGLIAFASSRTGFFEIFAMNARGHHVSQLTAFNKRSRGPAVSPDGRRIAFSSTLQSNNLQIYVMKADGSNVTRLTFDRATDANPAWSPDGTRLAFESNRNGSAQIFLMNADGGAVVQLTSGNQDHEGPSWSPDAEQIAYGTGVNCGDCANQTGVGNLEVHVINVDGTQDQVLESEAFIPGIALNTSRHPDWSPDGNRITYASTRSGSLQIWVMNEDGSEQTQVTNDPVSNNFPRFSPDGSRLVYQSGAEIHVIRPAGTEEKNLSSGAGADVMPNWGPASD
jgi:Tol biopolymer transport system component